MNQQNLKQKVVKGAVWTLLEQFSTQIVGFVVGMILARLLTPSDYGTVALTSIFFAVAGVLVDGGFGGALIQKKNADDLDFNSVFYLNFTLSLIAYAALFFAAPWIAAFYKTPALVAIVRVAAISLIFNAFNAIQNAELTKKMLFHLSFRISIITCLTSAICGITLAFLGFGVWALVLTTLISGFVGVVARWFIIAWRPRLMFSWQRLKPLFKFGWKMSAVAVIDQFFVNLNGLLIGRFYTKADLAYVNKGDALPRLAMTQIDGTLGRVSFPALVQIQDDSVKLRDAVRRLIQCSTFLVMPLMVGIAACAKSELLLLYGKQWLPAAPYMQLACFTFALWPIHTINLRSIMVLGRSDIFLTLEIIKKSLYLICILAFFRFGVFTFMAVTALTLGPLSAIINAWPNRKLIGYTIPMQLRDMFPTVAVCSAEAAVVFGADVFLDFLFSVNVQLPFFNFNSQLQLNIFLALKLMVQFLFGALTFLILAYAFRLKPMAEYMRMIKPLAVSRFPWILTMKYE